MSGRGIERILDLIEWLAAHPGAASLSQVSAALGIPKSSALQMLRTLTDRGYLSRGDTGDYLLLRTPGDLSGDLRNFGALLALATPMISRAVQTARESGFLAVMENHEIRYLNKILPEREILYDRDMTKTRAAHQVASGVVILAASDDDVADEYLAKLSGEEAQNLRRSIESARRDGYFLNLHGVVEGAAGAASPIFDSSGKVLGAVNISGPQVRMSAASELVCKVTRETAQAITDEIARRSKKI